MLILLGVLIAFLLAVLFAPVRYRIWGSKEGEETPEISLRIGWLFSIVCFSLNYKEESEGCCRIFGIPVWRNRKDTEPGKKYKKSKNKTKNASREAGDETVKDTTGKITDEIIEEVASENAGDMQEDTISKNSKEVQGKTINKINGDVPEDITVENTEETAEETKSMLTEELVEKTKKQKENRTERVSFPVKIKEKINSIMEKIKHIWEKVKEIWKNGNNRKEKIEEKFYNIKEFWNNKEHKEGIRQLVFFGKKILSHCLPKKWNGKVHFGMANPAQTGQVLAVLSVFYGLTGVMVEVEPDFEQAVLEGNFFAKGRIRTGTILWYVFQVWKSKEIIKLKDDFEELRRNL